MHSLGTKLTLYFGLVAALGAVVMLLVVSYTAFNGLDQLVSELVPAQQSNNQSQSQSSSRNDSRNDDNRGQDNDSRSRRFEQGTPAGNFEDVLIRGLLLGIGTGVVLAVGIGYLLAGRLIRPIRTLTQATHTLSEGNLGHQIPVTTQDEIGELTEAFNQMSHDLAQSNQLRRQMTADIAHDIRTPLTVIAGYTEGLRDGKLKQSTQTFEVMHQQVQTLQHLLDDLRTLSLADAGELTLNKREIDPRALIERAAVAYLQQAEAQSVAIEIDAPQALPSISVDVERMMQVLNNLVSNALRYTPSAGKIVLSASEESRGVLLSVRDTGEGIPAEDLPHIFERFYRADSQRSRSEHESSGLGLAITKAIVESHGGWVSAESQPTVGTTITIHLPTSASNI